MTISDAILLMLGAVAIPLAIYSLMLMSRFVNLAEMVARDVRITNRQESQTYAEEQGIVSTEPLPVGILRFTDEDRQAAAVRRDAIIKAAAKRREDGE